MPPDSLAATADPRPRGSILALALALAAAVHGCAAPGDSMAQRAAREPVPLTAPAAPAPIATPAMPAPVDGVLGYADRIRSLPPAELAQEIARLTDGADSPIRLMELAFALGQSRVPSNIMRAQVLVQRVLARDDAQARRLHPLARLVSAQLADARRADEQIEKHAQQLRDAQRRIEQLNGRLEAVRAIERSVSARPPAAAPAPAPAASSPAVRP